MTCSRFGAGRRQLGRGRVKLKIAGFELDFAEKAVISKFVRTAVMETAHGPLHWPI
jgi:hypothetical protein